MGAAGGRSGVREWGKREGDNLGGEPVIELQKRDEFLLDLTYEQQFVRTLPLGAGFKRTDQVFVNVPDLNPLIVENNDQMLFKNS